MKYLLAVFCLIGCGADTSDLKSYCAPCIDGVDKQVKPYVIAFEKTFGIKVSNIPIHFYTLDKTTAGICYVWAWRREIQIDPFKWVTYNKYTREELVFHELGHCVMNLGHIDDMVVIGSVMIPKSIMAPNLFGSKTYYEFHEYYIQQLKDMYKAAQ